jgi:hypothetical protein
LSFGIWISPDRSFELLSCAGQNQADFVKQRPLDSYCHSQFLPIMYLAQNVADLSVLSLEFWISQDHIFEFCSCAGQMHELVLVQDRYKSIL